MSATTMEPTEAGWMASTPWGMAQEVTKLGEGIWSVTTASHGGIRLGREREAEMRDEFPGFVPFAGWPWLEEDCDAVLAVLLWPELFAPAQVWSAVRSGDRVVITNGGVAWPVRGWLNGTARGRGVLRRVAVWQCQNPDLWLRGGGCTSGRYWVSDWTNVADGTRRSFRFTSYPDRSEARTADLDEWKRLGGEVTREA